MLAEIHYFFKQPPTHVYRGTKFLLPYEKFTDIKEYLRNLGYRHGDYTYNQNMNSMEFIDFELYIKDIEIITYLKIKYGQYFVGEF